MKNINPLTKETQGLILFIDPPSAESWVQDYTRHVEANLVSSSTTCAQYWIDNGSCGVFVTPENNKNNNNGGSYDFLVETYNRSTLRDNGLEMVSLQNISEVVAVLTAPPPMSAGGQPPKLFTFVLSSITALNQALNPHGSAIHSQRSKVFVTLCVRMPGGRYEGSQFTAPIARTVFGVTPSYELDCAVTTTPDMWNACTYCSFHPTLTRVDPCRSLV
eukprot:PhF_6_TR42414/c0_g1_i1/m.63970